MSKPSKDVFKRYDEKRKNKQIRIFARLNETETEKALLQYETQSEINSTAKKLFLESLK